MTDQRHVRKRELSHLYAMRRSVALDLSNIKTTLQAGRAGLTGHEGCRCAFHACRVRLLTLARGARAKLTWKDDNAPQGAIAVQTH
jgi:hypothetical protein